MSKSRPRPRRLSQAEMFVTYGNPNLLSGRNLIEQVWIDAEEAAYAPRGLKVNKTLKFASNKLVSGRLVLGMNQASHVSQWWPSRVDSYVVRNIAGSSHFSLHSWALAWDVFGPTGPIDPKTGLHRPPQAWINAMKLQGFGWGGDFSKNYDPHHFEWPWKPPIAE